MAITRAQSQVLWSGASTKLANTAAEFVSDTITLDDTTVALSVQLSANNQGTPASGDTAIWRIQWSNGDVLADSGDDYDTAEHAQFLAQLDTFSTNTPGENPARMTVSVTPVAKKFRLSCNCASGATRSVILSARVDEQRAA
jgi:hypothetical protein